MNLYDASKRQIQNFSRENALLAVGSYSMLRQSGHPHCQSTYHETQSSFPGQVNMAIFIGYRKNYVAFGVLVDVICYSLSVSVCVYFCVSVSISLAVSRSLSFFLSPCSLCVLVGVGGDRDSEART